jgi:putative phosphoesterase
MKLLVLSDSHRNISRMRLAAEQAQPDAILHLGDHIGDAFELQRELPGIPFHTVKGNCDFQAAGATELLLTFDGVSILMTHGHIFGVKSGLDALITRAKGQHAHLALYGHTHIAMTKCIRGIWLMNPGQTERHDNFRAASYGVVTVENGSFVCGVVRLPFTGS